MSDPVFREGDRLLLPVTVVGPWGTGEFNTLVHVDFEGGFGIIVPASLLVRESEVRARALEEAAKVADFWNDETVPQRIRALIEKPEGERS